MKKLFLLLALMTLGFPSVMAGEKAYVFSYFDTKKEDAGLCIAYSYDGYHWTAINDNRPVMRPTIGKDKLLRDPSICQAPDGTFHMVWTSSWTDQIIGYASSKDLIHWSRQQAIPVMKDYPVARNSWAPEVFYDNKERLYYIFWASTVPGAKDVKTEGCVSEDDYNHRIYCCTTRDFKKFSKTKLYYNPDFNAIDAAVVRDPETGELLMAVKNENLNPAEKNIRIARAKSMKQGFSTSVSAPIHGEVWCEGPAPLFVGNDLLVYYDMYRKHKYGASRSKDHGHTWEDVTDQISMPQDMSHGTAIAVDKEVVDQLASWDKQRLDGSFVPGAHIPAVTWDGNSLMMDGHRVMPAMGEIHYSRIPADEWEAEVKKMKEGGITIIACYVFWNHIEEIEGQYDWSGQRHLRRFLEICKKEALPVVLRMGPFCHGEARCGGIPDWVVASGCNTRSEDPRFLGYVTALYRQIFTQVQGLQWKDGGPVIAAQFDNEYGGHGSYLLALKRIANEIGFDLPFYTRTGWPELSSPIPYGEMIPLFGDYADGFWDRDLQETTGNYYKAFNFSASQVSGAIGSEQLDYSKTDSQQPAANKRYPYFTCELGGGMMTSYHRRVYIYPEDAYAMALVKLGSGSNLLGYYMYHGGTNPEGKLTYLNESQATPATNWNDLPVKTYDFQAPLNEFGLRNPHYYTLRKLHLFMKDYGEILAPMEAHFPCDQDIPKGDDSHLRWSYRSQGNSGFVFINNYERLQSLSAKQDARLEVCGVKFPEIVVPEGASCIFPVNIDGIKYATAQIVAKRDGNIYLEQIKGIPTEIAVDGKVLRKVKARGPLNPVYKNIYLLSSEEANRLFLDEEPQCDPSTAVTFRKTKEAGTPRKITIGVAGAAEEPVDAHFEQAAVYTIDIPDDHSGLLEIGYRGDVARLYANGKLIDDNFYNGRPFQYALWRLPKDCRQLELRILPLQKDMPVYFPREADVKEEGEAVNSVVVRNVP